MADYEKSFSTSNFRPNGFAYPVGLSTGNTSVEYLIVAGGGGSGGCNNTYPDGGGGGGVLAMLAGPVARRAPLPVRGDGGPGGRGWAGSIGDERGPLGGDRGARRVQIGRAHV